RRAAATSCRCSSSTSRRRCADASPAGLTTGAGPGIGAGTSIGAAFATPAKSPPAQTISRSGRYISSKIHQPALALPGLQDLLDAGVRLLVDGAPRRIGVEPGDGPPDPLGERDLGLPAGHEALDLA